MSGARLLARSALAAGLAVLIGCFSERQEQPTSLASIRCANLPVGTLSPGVVVAIRDFAFHTDTVRITRGESVLWINCEEDGVEPHTSTSDGGVWDSPLLRPGDRFARTFQELGTFPYHCTPHPFMKAVVVVQP
ncbi:MAG: cupredoxin family copper-binding protein [Gemmatimonadetes bacterium]|nr:cupredoxin family copper-binding protein [Gemmatimonadota bacterium]